MADFPVLTIHTDGASRGNPGDAAFAYVIEQDGQPPIEEAGCLGQMTNNQAEYTALLRALEHALDLGAAHRVLVHSDSELMVKQMQGAYKVKNLELRDLYLQARELCGQFEDRVLFRHVRREQNSRADALCNEALDGKRRPTPRGGQASLPAPSVAKVASLHADAVACLQQAAAAWQDRQSSLTADQVWEQLVAVLNKHNVSLAGKA